MSPTYYATKFQFGYQNLWLTQSKVISKSQNMPPTFSLLFKALSISLSSLQVALLVEQLYSESKLFIDQCTVNI